MSTMTLLMLLATWIVPAEESARLAGVVHDESGAVVPGVTATLVIPGATEPIVQVADGAGAFEFDGLRPGEYTLVLSLPGFRDVRHAGVLRPGDAAVHRFVLPLAALSEEVQVVAESPALDTRSPAGESRLQEQVLTVVPLAKDRFEDALPLLPAVVRGPDGLLNMSGTRAGQSGLVVNGINGTDPVTGQFAVRLPLEAVATIDVQAGVPSSQFGNATGGVASVVTRAGQDTLDFQFQNFLPRPRFEDGIKGIDAFTPRLRLAGPVQRGRLWVAESMNYRFARSRVSELEPDGLEKAEQEFQSFDSLTQIDYAVRSSHHFTGTFLWFPGSIDNLGLDTRHPFDSTPDLTQHGWNAAIAQRSVLGSRSVVDASLSIKQFDVAVAPKQAIATAVTPAGTTGSYFNLFDRESRRYDAAATLTRSAADHLVKAGGSLARTSYDGVDRSASVLVTGADGSPVRRIDFSGNPAVAATNTEAALFVEDQWSPLGRLTLNAGARYAYEAISGDHTIAPQMAASLRPFASDRTVFKAGYGRLYDKLPLNARDFETHQRRVVTTFDPSGTIAGGPAEIPNAIAPGGVLPPVADTWNIEMDQQLTAAWTLRVRYQERHGRNELVVDPQESQLVLASTGRSRSRSIEATGRRRLPRNAEINLSYVRSSARGNLNDFVALFGTLREPIILADEFSRQPFEAPDRVLAWGIVHLPFQLTVAPTVEWRTGFPFTAVDEEQRAVGSRNAAGRYPDVFTLDMQVTREVRLTGSHRARVGLQFFNLTDHFNPRDVQNNVDGPGYGDFANSVGRQVRLKFVLLF